MAIDIGYYSCEHQTSDSPCDICQPGEKKMPKNWRNTYEPPAEPGTSDAIKTD